MKRCVFLITFYFAAATIYAQPLLSPDSLYGSLFRAVEMQRVFPDSKTFPDCVPKTSYAAVMADWRGFQPGASLKDFVLAHFILPPQPDTTAIISDSSVTEHIKRLWPVLSRNPFAAVNESSLLPLPNPYIIPGGRFREVYYWDSFFTMLGLAKSGRVDMIGNMADNFAFLISRYGHIPNGNRTYYLSRSQPPLFACMVQLLAGLQLNVSAADSIYRKYLPALEMEYAYWTSRSMHHSITMPDRSTLSRYYDEQDVPRAESYREDVLLADTAKREKRALYRDIRSAAESGWDFSSRWLADGHSLSSIHTTDIIPVDLNCFLWQLEMILSKANKIAGNKSRANAISLKANNRKIAIGKYLWSKKAGFYMDYDWKQHRQTNVLSLAGMVPFALALADRSQMQPAANIIEQQFLRPGGVVTTLQKTGQQWDAPNGWAPMEWFTVTGLEIYGNQALARTIATRWIAINERVYRQTGKLMEKYNVADTTAKAGGGEYPSQDGFGWTNGVYLDLKERYQ